MVPWAAVVVTPEDRVLAAASPMFHGGLFWRRVGPGGRGCGSRRTRGRCCGGAAAEIDADYVIDYLAMRPPTAGTPYRGIGRLDSGSTFEFGPGRGAGRSGGVGSRRGGNPSGRVRVLRRTTCERSTLRSMMRCRRLGRWWWPLSGGLDSTFLAASLVRHASAQRPVVGLVHRPVAGVPTLVRPAMVTDDWPYAKALARKYPGLIGWKQSGTTRDSSASTWHWLSRAAVDSRCSTRATACGSTPCVCVRWPPAPGGIFLRIDRQLQLLASTPTPSSRRCTVASGRKPLRSSGGMPPPGRAGRGAAGGRAGFRRWRHRDDGARLPRGCFTCVGAS